MPGMQAIYKSEKVNTKNVWYTGTDKLKKGYALCYDRDRGTATAVDGTRTSYVEKPASGNLHNFAGIVVDNRPKVGPTAVNIAIPTGPHEVHEVFTEESCTQNSTILTVKPASYYFGGASEGLPVGIALQTVDRSSTNGLVQAQIAVPNFWDQPFGFAVPSSTNNVFSPAIWETCPYNLIKSGRIAGSIFETDYLHGFQPVTATTTTEIEDWIQTENTSGQTLVSDLQGGVLRISSEAFVAAEDGLCVAYRQPVVVPTASKPWWFECRVKLADIDTTPDQFYIGLADPAVTEMSPSGVLDDTVDKAGFYSQSGTTAATLEFVTSKTSVQEQTTGAATGLVDATWFNLGMVGTGSLSITPYVNGVAGTAHATAASLPTVANGLSLVLGAQVDQTATIATIDIDWVRIVQLG